MTTKAKTWRRPNPRDVVIRLIAENPKAGKRKLLALFLEQVAGRDGNSALNSVAEYWFEAHWENLKGPQP
jgi:hypothetical protein